MRSASRAPRRGLQRLIVRASGRARAGSAAGKVSVAVRAAPCSRQYTRAPLTARPVLGAIASVTLFPSVKWAITPSSPATTSAPRTASAVRELNSSSVTIENVSPVRRSVSRSSRVSADSAAEPSRLVQIQRPPRTSLTVENSSVPMPSLARTSTLRALPVARRQAITSRTRRFFARS